MNRCVIFLSIVVDMNGHSVSCASLERKGRENRVVVVGQEQVSITRPRGGGIVSAGEFSDRAIVLGWFGHLRGG